jgi:uncharacterized protein (DUF58 family)
MRTPGPDKGSQIATLRRFVKWSLGIWYRNVTPAGNALLAAAFLACVAGSVTFSIPIYHLFCGIIAPIIVAFLCGLTRLPRMKVSGVSAPKGTAGQTVVAEFTLRNESRQNAYDVGLGYMNLPRALDEISRDDVLDAVASGDEGVARVAIRPARRGVYPLPQLKCFTAFPFHLWRLGRSVTQRSKLLVLPAFQKLLDVDIPIGRKYQPGGVALSAHLGESTEYVGNRAYRPGDPPRLIDFRAWARLTEPVVREYHEEYYCRIALVLDTFVKRGRIAPRAGFEELEAAVSLSASIADVLDRGDYIIDLFAAGPDLYVFRAGRNIAHFDNLLEILACVGACRRSPFETVAPALSDELSNITAVIYVLLDWDDERELFVRAAVEAGSQPKVVIVRNGEPTKSFAAAEEWAGPIRQFTPADVQSGALERL